MTGLWDPSHPIKQERAVVRMQGHQQGHQVCDLLLTMHPWFIDLLMIGLGCLQHSGQGRKMAKALEYEKTDKHGDPIKCLTTGTTLTVCPPQKSCQAKKQRIDPTEVGASLDEDDCDYQDTKPVESESTSPSEGNCQDTLPSNTEASSLLCIFVLFWHMQQSTYRLQRSYHLRWSPLWDEVLLESAHIQSQQLLLRSNLSAALQVHAATTNWMKHVKKGQNQWCIKSFFCPPFNVNMPNQRL